MKVPGTVPAGDKVRHSRGQVGDDVFHGITCVLDLKHTGTVDNETDFCIRFVDDTKRLHPDMPV